MTVKSLIAHLSMLDGKLDVHVGGHGGKVTKLVKADYIEDAKDPKKAKRKTIVVLVGV